MVFVAVYVAYSLARGLSTGEIDTALQNARRVVQLQADLGLNIEFTVQQTLLSGPAMTVFNLLYLLAQLAVVPVGLVLVYRRRPDVYPLLRTTVIAAWGIAIPLYALFPTAPPRLAGIGILDTVSSQTPFALDSPMVTAFYNPVAAVPSLHAAFAFAIGIAVATTTRHIALKLLAWLWGPLVVLVVIATGNHFVLDIAMGLLVTLIGYMIALALDAGLLHGMRPNRLLAIAANALAAAGSRTALATAGRAVLATAGPGTRAPERRERSGRRSPGAPTRPERRSRPAAPRPTRPRPPWSGGGDDLAGLRVAMVCPYAWDSPGGVRTHVIGLASELRSRGIEVDILAPMDGESEEDVIALGPTVGLRSNGSIARVAVGPAAAARTLRRLREGNYDLVHLHEPLCPAVCLAPLLKSQVPVVGTFHMYGPEHKGYRVAGPFARIAAERLTARIAVSEPARYCAAQFCGGDYTVIPNGIDPPAPRAEPPARDGSRVLFVGRAELRKGLPVLLEAFAGLPGSPTLDLVGVEQEELERQPVAIPAEVATRIRAHGRVSEGDREHLLARADVLAAPSLAGESFGLVLVEGMAAGVPVVASSIPGYAEVLRPSSGRLVPPGDVDALRQALGELLGDERLRTAMAAAGPREAERFWWPRVADQVVLVYAGALARAEQRAARR
ncbi:MAG: phosphatidyl-myo-inositol alpha-mannosyltransferase [Miltoncostaeaceae bacterium]|jgi:phosphatidylinositol alpha-mannosyltransferase|nr:phosphatidyl-myo-inositol alpha-mannosyltransferase [Miltoncostaeaceae bacterium]